MARVTTLVLFGVIAATPAAAQPARQAAHHQSIGGGTQWALPYPGQGTKPGVQASWRRWFSPRLGVGTEFRWWERRTRTEFNSPAPNSPGAGLTPTVQGRDDERLSSYGVGVGVLARTSAGRLSLIAGAGPGFFADRRIHERLVDTLHDGSRSTERSIGVHTLADMDVRATSRLSVFAGLRIEVRDLRALESASGYPTAGVRFAF